MKKGILFLFLLNCVLFKTKGCLNTETKYLANGTLLYKDDVTGVPHGHQFSGVDTLLRAIKDLDSLYITTKDIDYLSDKGLVLILLKKYTEAIDLYIKIEKLEPGRYSTASNIGTAYELMGDNKRALKWIRKAVKIDNSSHHESEWIHVNILEVKTGKQKAISGLSLINTDFGGGNLPVTQLTQNELFRLSVALYYQLNERMSFIKPEEKIVARLLFEFGNIAFLTNNKKDAITSYKLAKDYGYANELIDKRLNLINVN